MNKRKNINENKLNIQNTDCNNSNIRSEYIKLRSDNDNIRIQEMNKMDHIVFNSSFGGIGVAFTFIALIYPNKGYLWEIFCLSIMSYIISIILSYLSSLASVKDIKESNNILDNNYEQNKSIYENEQTFYKPLIDILNKLAMIFLIFGFVFFSFFVYSNFKINKLLKECITMNAYNKYRENGCDRNSKIKPITEGADRNDKIKPPKTNN